MSILHYSLLASHMLSQVPIHLGPFVVKRCYKGHVNQLCGRNLTVEYTIEYKAV